MPIAREPSGLRVDLRTAPGSGASGGLGAGLAAALGARLRPRFEVLVSYIDLDAAVAVADLVITAEGSVDGQTTRGKVPGEVARVAARHGKPVVAHTGTVGPDAGVAHDAGITGLASILPGPTTLEDAIARGPEYLCDAAERVMRLLQIGRGLA